MAYESLPHGSNSLVVSSILRSPSIEG